MGKNKRSSGATKRREPKVSEPTEAQLRPHGFEGGEPIYELLGNFRVKDALAALTGSTYSNPIPVHLKNESADVNIPVIITMMKACYQPFAPYLTTPAGCHDTPEWYFEGWVLKSGYDTFTGFTRVRIYVTDEHPDDPDAHTDGYWQVIPTDPDPNAPLWVA